MIVRLFLNIAMLGKYYILLEEWYSLITFMQ
jgi:hypothetical protein